MLTEPSHAGMSAGKNIYISVLISILNLRVKKKTVCMCSIQLLAKTESGKVCCCHSKTKKLEVNLTEITWPLQVVGLVGSWTDHFLADPTCFKSCIESRIVATTVSPCMEELPKATLHQCFMLSTTILVYPVTVPSLAATEPQQ